MGQPVSRFVPLKAHFQGCAQLHLVDFPALLPENIRNMPDIVPIRLHIEGPHEGKDHTLIVTLHKLVEDHLPQLLGYTPIERTENLDHRFDHHMIVKQPKAGLLHQLLSHRHLSDSGIAN